MERLHSLLRDALEEEVFPGAVLLVSAEGKERFFGKVGYLSIIPQRIPLEPDTIFDLASLTKPLATTLAIMRLIDGGRLCLEDNLGEIFPFIFPDLKASISIRNLLSHSSGMSAWQPFYKTLKHLPLPQRKPLLRKIIADIPLAERPGTETIYSDLGFMILEWVIETVTGKTLDVFLEETLYGPLGLKRTFFAGTSSGFSKHVFAATEDCPWRGHVLQGEVHDENAWILGGFSGHAGLFSTASEVNQVLNLILSHYRGERSDFFKTRTVRDFFTSIRLPPWSTWALGWDTPSPSGSSSGAYFSRKSVGHLGFTGTSVWMDLEKGICVTFLTNRVHPSRDNVKLKAFRPVLHNAVMEELASIDK
ncbi:MAG: serine hydrolase [Desulfobacteraceae bacterium]|nr:MAG: serine hydrolase [Desulfobacteraceae bacterium]